MDDVGTDNLWAWVRAGDEQVVAAAMHTPPFGAYVSVGSDDAMRELAACFHRSGCGLPGAGGLRPQVEAFADEWVRLTGVAVEVTMRQGVYAADAVIPPTGVDGRCRWPAPRLLSAA